MRGAPERLGVARLNRCAYLLQVMGRIVDEQAADLGQELLIPAHPRQQLFGDFRQRGRG